MRVNQDESRAAPESSSAAPPSLSSSKSRPAVLSPAPAGTTVAVLSLSRSGSSLVARVLHEVLGIDFGEPIEHIPANRNNPDGYFEQAELVAIDDAILAAAGGAVFDPPAADYAGRLEPSVLQALMRRIRDFVEYRTLNRQTFGLKDPRLALTFPLWKRAMPTAIPVIVFRDPGAAAVSIVDQGRIPLQQALDLWFEYYWDIFQHTSGMPRYVVSFERLLAAPDHIVSDLARHLGIDLDEDALTRELQRVVHPDRPASSKKVEPTDLSPYVSPETKLVYGYLRARADAGRQPDFDYLGAMFAGLRAHREYARREAEQRPSAFAKRGNVGTASVAITPAGAGEVGRRRVETEGLQNALQMRTAELLDAQAALARACADQREVEQLQNRIERLLSDLKRKDEETDRVVLQAIERADLSTERMREDLLRSQRAEVARFARQIGDKERDIHELRHARYLDHLDLDASRRAAEDLATRLARLIDSRFMRLLARLRQDDLWAIIGPAGAEIKAQSQCWHRRGFRLQTSRDLTSVPYQEYRMRGENRDIRAVLLAPVMDVPWGDGVLGVEIVSPDDRIVVNTARPIGSLTNGQPAEFSFPPVSLTSSRGWRLRVFGRSATTPVRVFEFRRYRLRFGPLVRRSFCAFLSV